PVRAALTVSESELLSVAVIHPGDSGDRGGDDGYEHGEQPHGDHVEEVVAILRSPHQDTARPQGGHHAEGRHRREEVTQVLAGPDQRPPHSPTSRSSASSNWPATASSASFPRPGFGTLNAPAVMVAITTAHWANGRVTDTSISPPGEHSFPTR